MIKQIVSILQNINDDIPSDPNAELLDNGIIDSFDIVNIVADIEKTFDITINPEDITPENFSNINSMVTLVKTYQ